MQTWQTVQRLSALGYDWHNTMHMIAAVVSDDLHQAVQEHRQFDPGDYARRLNELPGNWPHRRHSARIDRKSITIHLARPWGIAPEARSRPDRRLFALWST